MSGRDTIASRAAQRAVEHPDHPFIEVLDGDGRRLRSMTWGQVWSDAEHLAERLSAVGVGAHVAILVPPGPEAVVAQLACQLAGCAFVPLNAAAPAGQLHRELRQAGCSAAIVREPTPTEVSAMLVRELPDSAVGPPSFRLYHAERGGSGPAMSDRDETAAIIFSSGSTGTPKGARFRSGSLTLAADESIAVYAITERDRLLCNVPLHHMAANSTLVWPAITAGAQLVFAPFSASRYFDIAAAAAVTFGVLNAAHIRMIVSKGAPPRSHLMRRGSTGFAITPDRLREFETRYDIELFNGYGSTETLGHITSQRVGRPRVPGGVGRPIGNRTVRIRSREGAECPPWQTGEICVGWSSPDEVTSGYVGDEVGTPALLGSGEIATGDLGYLTPDGELFFVDRMKDIIKHGGATVSPIEVEEVIAHHRDVAEVAVVGVADDILGEIPVAVVVPAGDPDAGLAERLVRHCAGELADYKVPRRVVVVATLPRTPMGKLDKRAIRTDLAASDGH